jgi:uncharacterized repeat protein (TIGR01451 family)
MQHPTWLAFLLVVSLILPLAPAPVAAQAPAVPVTQVAAPDDAKAVPAAPDLGEGKYEVRWTFTANASGSGQDEFRSWTAYRNVLVQGSMIVEVPQNAFAIAEPFQLTVTDTSQSIENGFCYQRLTREYITDPSRYSGKSDPFFSSFGGQFPRQRDDGSWYMPDPFYLHFWIDGQVFRSFPYQYIREYKDLCHPPNSSYSEEIRETVHYMDWFDFPHGFETQFEGDSEGVVFRKSMNWTMDYHFVDDFQSPLNISYHATIRRIGGCADRRGSIDANDPVVKDIRLHLQVNPQTIPPNDGDTLNPPDPAIVSVLATCEGVPVRNVTLKVAVDALPNSGGHHHTTGTNPRPRGFLRGPQHNNYIEITRRTPSINVTTNNQGEATIRFRPGRDYDSGTRGGRCAGDQRGIAGDYKLDIESTLPARLAGKQLDTTILVERTDFVELVDGPNFYIRYNSTLHPNGTSGKPATMQVIQRLADDFNAAQVAHNATLAAAGKPAWPIVELAIIDISLEDGGLYDSGGTNVCADGQPRVNFIPWQIPHQTHLTGRGIDISTAVWWASATTPAQFRWWRNKLRELGCNYGTWAREAVFHLDADQSAEGWGDFHTGCTYTPDAAAAALDATGSPAMVTVPRAGADLFVSLLPDTLDEEIVLAAPGEVVSYTVGVSNAQGDAAANDVEVKAALPAGVTFVAGDPAPSRFDGAAPVWEIGNLPAGGLEQLYTFSIKVNAGSAPGTILYLEAAATTTSAETITDNNREGNEITVRAAGPDLVALSDLEGVPLTADAPVTVTFNLANAGSAVAPNASLAFTLPAGVDLVSSAPLSPTQAANVLNWQLGAFAADAEQALTVVLDMSDAATLPFDPVLGTGAPVTLTWQAKTTGDIDLSNNSGVVAGALTLAGHDARVVLGVTGAPVGGLVAGQTVTFTLSYANLGNRTAEGAALSLRLGGGLKLLSAQPPAGPPVDGVLPWTLGDLAVDAEGSVVVRAQVESVPAKGSLTVAAITAENFDIAPANNVVYDDRETIQTAGGGGGEQRFFLPLLDR